MNYDKLINYCESNSITEDQALKMIKLSSFIKFMINTLEEDEKVNED